MKLSRSLAALSAAALSLSIVPGLPGENAALAANPYTLASSCDLDGTGASANPHIIRTVTDLLAVEACVEAADGDIYFEQVSNVYMDSNRNYPQTDFSLSGNNFSYDGGGFGIFGLNQSVDGGAGLFADVRGGGGSPVFTVRDLHISAGTIAATDNLDNSTVGALIGSLSEASLVISNVSAEVGRIEAVQSGSGLIGNLAEVNGSISSSFVRVGEIVLTRNFGSGGLVGAWSAGNGQARIENSRAIADFTVVDGQFGEGTVGGLVGSFDSGTLTIEKSQYRGDINGGDKSDTLGGVLGLAITFDNPTSVVIQDTVTDVAIVGENFMGGLVGNGYNHNGNHDINLTVRNSLVTGELSSSYFSTAGGGLIGEGRQTNLVVDNVVLDLDFTSWNSGTPSGNFVADPPLTRNISDLYVNAGKVASSQWTLTDLSSQSNWGATLVSSANFADAASFPALTFSATNGAPESATWEVCPSGTRPHHSIEASNCSTPAIDYPTSLSLAFGETISTGFTGDASHFLYFTVSPSLPDGLYLDPATGKLAGVTLAQAAANDYTITAVAASGSAQDVVSILVAAPSGQVTLKSNLSPSQPDQTLGLGIVTAPTDPFVNSPYALAGWGLGGTTGRIFAPGAKILITSSADLYAIWAIGPDCADNSGTQVGEFYVLCEDPDGRTLRVTSSLPDDEISYFVAETATTGEELWVTDGTSAGTRLLFEMEPGVADGADEVFGLLNGRVLFTGTEQGTYGLYSSDGTLANTLRLSSLENGILDLVSLDSVAVFSARTANEGRELWVTDGTRSGTALLSDLIPGTSSGWPNYFVRWGSDAYFVADTTQYGWEEIFVTDGTSGGTAMAFELDPGAGNGGAYGLTVANDKLFFASYETGLEGLWVVDNPQGTPQKLVSGNVTDIATSPDGLSVVFGFDPTTSNLENELWKSDGTIAGTQKVAEIAAAGIDAEPYSFFDDGELIYFNSTTANGDTLAWKSDLTAAGTAQILSSLTSPQIDGSVGSVVFGDYLVSSGIRALMSSGPAPEESQDQQQSPTAVAVPTNLPRLTGIPTFSNATGILSLPGANLDEVFRIEIQGIPLFSRFDNGVLSVQVPSSLAIGERSLQLFSTSGRLTIQHTFTQTVAETAVVVAAWTKKLDDDSVKIYAKNIVGAGKIQFMVNGKEVAWIRTDSEADPKLRTANGSHYLVRTISLAEGKNALEVYVDGERVRRSAYTR